MENPICEAHGQKFLKMEGKENKNYYLCRICLFNNKDQISYYEENFNDFKTIYFSDESVYLDIIEKNKEFDGFDHINKIFKEKITGIEIENEFFEKIETNASMFKFELKEGYKSIYDHTTKKLEDTVEHLNSKTDKLDLSLKSVKDEVEAIQESLEEQIQLLENEKTIKQLFEKVRNKFLSKLKYFNKEKYFENELKVNFKKGFAEINFTNGTPISKGQGLGDGNRGGYSYRRDVSNTVLEGPFTARLRVNSIQDTHKTSDWYLNIGLQRAESQNSNSYYQDGVFFMSSGKITQQFQGSVSRNMFRPFNNGDEIIIHRNEKNEVYFGIDDESKLEKAYDNISGKFRLCVGYMHSNVTDEVEILEIDFQTQK